VYYVSIVDEVLRMNEATVVETRASDENRSFGPIGYMLGQRVILLKDPFGIYVLNEITRAGRLILVRDDGTKRSVMAIECSHPYNILEKKGK